MFKFVARAVCHFELQTTFTSHDPEASIVKFGRKGAVFEICGWRASSAGSVPKLARLRPSHVKFAMQKTAKNCIENLIIMQQILCKIRNINLN